MVRQRYETEGGSERSNVLKVEDGGHKPMNMGSLSKLENTRKHSPLKPPISNAALLTH